MAHYKSFLVCRTEDNYDTHSIKLAAYPPEAIKSQSPDFTKLLKIVYIPQHTIVSLFLYRWKMLADIWSYVGSVKFKICFVASLWGFLTGLERAVIIPTLWLYFSTAFSTIVASQYYGWTLAAFNVAILLCDPLFGYLSFVRVRVKTLLVISNQLGIIGNIIYFIASHPWMVLVGRLLAGAGAGCEVPLYADIVRVTSVAERTPYIITLLLCRQFGLIVGPACTLLMSTMHFKLGQVSIDIYNGPGLLLACLWGVHTILVLLIYPQVQRQSPTQPQRESTPLNSTGGPTQQQHRDSYCSDIIDATLLAPAPVKPGPLDSIPESPSPQALSSFTSFFNPQNYGAEYTRYGVLSCLVAIFASYFSLMGLETVLPPMASHYFQWTAVQTSWVYLGCGLTVVVVYLCLRLVASRGVQDRTLLLTGLVLLTSSYLWLSASLAFIDSARPRLFIGLIILGIGLHVLGQPFAVSCSESLYTKQLPPPYDQDRAQALLRIVINVALLVGPFVGGSLESYPYIVFLLLLASVIAALLPLIFRFSAFVY